MHQLKLRPLLTLLHILVLLSLPLYRTRASINQTIIINYSVGRPEDAASSAAAVIQMAGSSRDDMHNAKGEKLYAYDDRMFRTQT